MNNDWEKRFDEEFKDILMQSFVWMRVRFFIKDERKAAYKEALEDCQKEIVRIRGFYPEDVFIPLKNAELLEVAEFRKSKGKTMDALSAHIMRMAIDIVLKKLKSLADEKEKQK